MKKKEEITLELIKKNSDKLERRCDPQKVTEFYELKRILISKKTDAYLFNKENAMSFEEEESEDELTM